MLPPAYGSRPATDPRLITCPVLRSLKSKKISDENVPERERYSQLAFDKELGHRNKTEDIRLEHGLHLIWVEIPHFVDTQDKACIVHYSDIVINLMQITAERV